MKDKEIFKNLLQKNKFVFAIKEKDSNLEINTSYIYKGSEDFFTLYLVEDVKGEVYLTDGAWILDNANNLDFDTNLIIEQSKEFDIKFSERQFISKVDILNIEDIFEIFVNFAKTISIIE